MKRKLLAVLGALVVGGAVYASAATLNVSAATLGEGSSTVASCNGGTPVESSFNTSYSARDGEFVVDSVTVSHIAAACNDKTLNVVLADDGNSSIGAGVAIVAAKVDDSSQTVPVTPTPVSGAVAKTVIQLAD